MRLGIVQGRPVSIELPSIMVMIITIFIIVTIITIFIIFTMTIHCHYPVVTETLVPCPWQLVSAQEVERKRGVPLDQTEEQIRMRLEDLYVQLMQPTQYRVSSCCVKFDFAIL